MTSLVIRWHMGNFPRHEKSDQQCCRLRRRRCVRRWWRRRRRLWHSSSLTAQGKVGTICRVSISTFVVFSPTILLGPVVPEPGGPGGPLAPPIFGRSVNPIWTGEDRLSPPITTGPPPQCFSPSYSTGVNLNPFLFWKNGLQKRYYQTWKILGKLKKCLGFIRIRCLN